jgi:hypothetical protein
MLLNEINFKEVFYMFENKTFEGIYYSRFIASYVKVRGKIYTDEFRDWLRSLTINGKKLSEEEIWDIVNLGTSGKLELESNCKNFFKK